MLLWFSRSFLSLPMLLELFGSVRTNWMIHSFFANESSSGMGHDLAAAVMMRTDEESNFLRIVKLAWRIIFAHVCLNS
uniref:Putative secreted peptide n=1 Tax=Anopheles braziliensis TaxID=58242 RepID=A0A2M3ZWQ9_9DIPT